MTEPERRLFQFLLLVDGAGIIVSMIAGPLRHTAVAIGAGASAALISVCLVGYGLYCFARSGRGS